MSAPSSRPDYGLDAPAVVRNLLIVFVAGLLLWGTAAAGWWSGRLVAQPSASVRLVFPMSRMVIWPALACGLMGFWMIWDSRVGKVRNREKLLQHHKWTGVERVLDIGCGRGLMLIGAAKKLTTGTATGVDIWSTEDLSGNRPDATLRNAELEGVADRVEIKTADMRELPFPDATFDVIVSCAAIHNLYAAADRQKALAEIARVLKPGGSAIIDDIRHGGEYIRSLSTVGCSVTEVGSTIAPVAQTILSFGSLRPVTLLARKS